MTTSSLRGCSVASSKLCASWQVRDPYGLSPTTLRSCHGQCTQWLPTCHIYPTHCLRSSYEGSLFPLLLRILTTTRLKMALEIEMEIEKEMEKEMERVS